MYENQTVESLNHMSFEERQAYLVSLMQPEYSELDSVYEKRGAQNYVDESTKQLAAIEGLDMAVQVMLQHRAQQAYELARSGVAVDASYLFTGIIEA